MVVIRFDSNEIRGYEQYGPVTLWARPCNS